MRRIEMGQLEESVDVYETFFESYSRLELMTEDERQENHIIITFLFKNDLHHDR